MKKRIIGWILLLVGIGLLAMAFLMDLGYAGGAFVASAGAGCVSFGVLMLKSVEK